MSTMQVSPEELRASAELYAAALGASGADGTTFDMSGDVGDDGLATAMTAFGEAWESGAEQLTRATEGIADSLRSSAQTYEWMDRLVQLNLGGLLLLPGGPK